MSRSSILRLLPTTSSANGDIGSDSRPANSCIVGG
jgi:hypothetical protein